jgi:hypothetical protein
MADIVNPDGSRVNRLTQTGDTIGTPLYMSPEQCSGSQADERSDIYSLGCVMYECLAGKPPFDSPSIFEVMNQHLNQIPTSLQQAAQGQRIPRQLEEVVFRALEKKQSDRYQSADELLSDLRSFTTAHGGHRTIDRLPSPRLRQQWRQAASRASSHKKLLAAIFVVTGSLLGAIVFLTYNLIHSKSSNTESQICVYHPPAHSCVSNVNYASCPTAGPLAREIVGILDTNYPRICKTLGLPENVLTRKITILLLSDAQAAPAMVSGDTFEFNVGKFQRGEIHLGVLVWQLSMIMEQFPDPINSQFSRPAWLRTALADINRASAVGVRNDPFCAQCTAGQTPLKSSACGAAFLLYVQKKYPNADMVKVVVHALSKGTYSRDLWKRTGKSLDELWSEFTTHDRPPGHRANHSRARGV